MSDSPAEVKVCPKCAGIMEEGKMYASGGNVIGVATGSGGIGIRVRKNSEVDKGSYWPYHVQIFICTKCNYLESYLKPKE